MGLGFKGLGFRGLGGSRFRGFVGSRAWGRRI